MGACRYMVVKERTKKEPEEILKKANGDGKCVWAAFTAEENGRLNIIIHI